MSVISIGMTPRIHVDPNTLLDYLNNIIKQNAVTTFNQDEINPIVACSVNDTKDLYTIDFLNEHDCTNCYNNLNGIDYQEAKIQVIRPNDLNST